MSYKQTSLWTAIVTPFNNDLTIDYESFKLLLKEQEEALNGVVVLGSTGENLSFSTKEKEEIVKFATSLHLKIPIMVGVGGFNLPETSAWVKFLETQNVQCYLLVTPIYAKPNEEGQYHWFKILMDHSTRPCMLYNIPSRAGTKLNLKAVKRLENHPQFWAIKESSGSVTEFEEYAKTLPNIFVYCGDDPLLPYYVYAGAKGLVSVASNVWPKETHQYVKKCLSNKTEGLFPLWQEATNALFTCANPIPAKALLHSLKRIKTEFTRPPLSHEDMKTLAELKNFDQKIKSWGKANGL